MKGTRLTIRVAAAAALALALDPLVNDVSACFQPYFIDYPQGRACVCLSGSGIYMSCEPGFDFGDPCTVEDGCA
jgi:hypothetical protein